MDTWPLEFRVRPGFLETRKEDTVRECNALLKMFFPDCDLVYKDLSRPVLRALFSGSSGIGVLLQGKNEDLLTFDINWPKMDDSEFREKVTQFGEAIQDADFYQKTRTPEYPYIPPLKRGRPVSLYTGCDTVLTEYDFDRLVFAEVSDYNYIRILHSNQFGNCLFLDNVLHIAESDLEIARAITGFDQEDYADKTVLILGGGDGGVLHYLKSRDPAMITMIEIDERVIDAAKHYLRGICHDAFDSLSGHNYQVIADDCVKYLKKYVREKRVFDYVIGDLTDIPVSVEPVGSDWDFLRRILSLSMQVLKPDGKFFTHGNSQLRPNAIAMYEDQLRKLECPVVFVKKVVCVPSYLENWYFYKIWKA